MKKKGPCLIHEIRIRQLENELKVLREEARRDPLTGLLNRRGFKEQVENILAILSDERNGKHGRSSDRHHLGHASLVFIDLNKFKKVNDTYGHPAGDELLRQFARFLKLKTRKIDILGRLSGDEFVVFLPKTDRREAQKFVSKASGDLAQVLFRIGRKRIALDAAWGISSTSETKPPFLFERLIARSDRGMYRHKRAQR